jgi:hypothetical protein
MLIGLLGLIPVNQSQELAGPEAGIFFRVLNSSEANNYNDLGRQSLISFS